MVRRPKSGVCVYCGIAGAITSDHVPPKCLFPTQSRVNLITVPSCQSCNASFQSDDEYFRLVLSLRADLPEGPAAEFLREATKRALRRPEASGFLASVMQAIAHRSIHSSGGIYLGQAPTLDVNYRRMTSTASRIVKGLFAHIFHKPLPPTYVINIMFTDLQRDTSAIDNPQIKELLTILGQSGTHRESNNTIEVWTKLAEDDDCASFWYVRVSKAIGFFAFTTPDS